MAIPSTFMAFGTWEVLLLDFSVERTCMNRGQIFNGSCDCDPLYSGSFCQYEDDCNSHEYCGVGRGVCVQHPSSPYPQKQCYCMAPFFGKRCDSKFVPTQVDLDEGCFNYSFSNIEAYGVPVDPYTPIHSQNSAFVYGFFNPNCYNTKNLGDKGTLHWRKVADEMEIVLDFSTNSWVAVGWRPDGLTKRCQKYPGFEEGESEPESEPVGRAEPNTHAEHQPFPENPFLVHNHVEHAVPAVELGSLPEPPSTASVENVPEAEHNHEGSGRVKRSSKGREPLEHPMDCTDMVVASAHAGKYLKIGDYYTRDRSTPMLDEIYEGQQSITAAYGFEKDGKTVVMFRKPIFSSDKADHSFRPHQMEVIWATGQDRSSDNLDFYKNDVLKYHGGSSRGKLKMKFQDDGASAVSVRKFCGTFLTIACFVSMFLNLKMLS